MINILHINNGWPDGGITEQVYLLCKHLPKDKFKQYSIGYCHFDGRFVEKFIDVGVECIASDISYSTLLDVIREKNIDIVHRQTGGGDFPYYCIDLYKNNIPLIETIHCPRASGIPIELLRKIVYTTPYTLYKNKKEYFDKMIAIPYAVDLHEPIFSQARYNESDNIIVGRLGRIIPDKRIDVICLIADMAYKDFGDKIQFKLAGYIPDDYDVHIRYGNIFKEIVSASPNIEYVGYVENKFDFWRSLDICVNFTQEASFEVVFLEAMACGVPILAWDESCSKYVVGNAGLVSNGNAYEAYESLKKLYYDPKLREFLGNIGIRYIKEKYSLSNMINSYVSLYEDVLASSKGKT